MRNGIRRVLAMVSVALTAGGCSPAAADLAPPQRLRVEVLQTLPHDRASFTQGLELADGVLYEGTGLEGRSSVLAVDPATGAARSKVDLPAPLFGEGITVVGDRIWQLTWRDGVALLRDRASLKELSRVSYGGEGWGLCFDGTRLVMSDGTDTLTFRDPRTFAETGRLRVRRHGAEVTNLNELECTGGTVLANVWQTDEILRIAADTGAVTGVVDASGLLPEADRDGADVLNGIAAVPGGTEFLLTGKLWPSLFRVRLVPAP